MAHFRDDDPKVWEQLDYRLLQNGPITMYWRASILEDDIASLAAANYQVDRVPCATWTSREAAHAALARAFDFPDYYGKNLDALDDCVSDLAVSDHGRVIVLEHFDIPAAALGDFAYVVLDIFAGTARTKLLFGKRLLVLVQTDDPALGFPPVGACAVGWNPREWLNKSRGL